MLMGFNIEDFDWAEETTIVPLLRRVQHSECPRALGGNALRKKLRTLILVESAL